jgi:hypothetical protein
MTLLGLQPYSAELLHLLSADVIEIRCRSNAGIDGVSMMLFSLLQAEAKAKQRQALQNANVCILLPDHDLTVLPLPDTNSWKESLTHDSDTSIIITKLSTNESVLAHELVDKAYFPLLQLNCLETKDGILYFYEHSKSARLQQLRLCVVPIPLWRLVVVACHTCPFGGHSGINKTLYRVQTRFWWPGLTRDITEGVAHCNLANAVLHEAKMQLHTLACNAPFDVLFLDLWSPGYVSDKSVSTKLLTLLDCMTGFAMGAFLSGDINSETVADTSMCTFFTIMGLPRLVVVDADNLFSGVFKQLFTLLQIPIHQVSHENHKAIPNVCFH